MKNRKLIISMFLGIMLLFILMPISNASAGTIMEDKSKIAFYYQTENVRYNNQVRCHLYIKVAKNLPDKKVYFTCKSKYDDEVITKEAKYFKDLDNNYEIYTTYVDSYNYSNYKFVVTTNPFAYTDSNNGKFYNNENILGEASLCVLRNNYCGGACNYPINVAIKNIAYEKQVYVHYTTDNGLTYKDAPLSYKGANSDGSEMWKTTIDNSMADKNSFKYSIYYKVSGNTYLDNNFGEFYTFKYMNDYYKGDPKDLEDIDE